MQYDKAENKIFPPIPPLINFSLQNADITNVSYRNGFLSIFFKEDAAGKEVVLSAEEDVLVLTQKAGKQLVKDRTDHNNMLLNGSGNGCTKDTAGSL